MPLSGLLSHQRTIPLVAVAVLIGDQITKAIAVANIPLHTRVSIVDGFFAFAHAHNRGMAFGLFNNIGGPWLRWILVGVAFLAVLIIWSYARHETNRPGVLFAFGAILGGALGNLVDRLRFGYVEDFVLAHWGTHEWPAFNLADAAITMGGIALFLTLAREQDEPEASTPPTAETSSEIGPDAGSTAADDV
jgi:signal peptidase II